MRYLFFSLCASIHYFEAFAQVETDKQLWSLMERKIESVSKYEGKTTGSTVGNTNIDKAPLNVADTKNITEKHRTISITTTGKTICRIKHMKRASYSGNVTTEYDSDNNFEQDPYASAMASEVEDCINKDFVIDNPRNRCLYGWVMGTLATHKNEVLSSIMIDMNPAMASKTIGTTWSDTTHRNEYTYYWQYKLEAIESNKAQLSANLTRSSGSGETNWKGKLWIDVSNGFIFELNMAGIGKAKQQVAGSSVVLSTISSLKVTNK